MPQQLITIREAAEHLAVSSRTVRRLIEAGEIKALKVGAQLRITDAELDRYLARQAKVAARSPVPLGG